MKKNIFIIVFVLIAFNIQAQFKQNGKKPNQMIEDIKIVKIIEILELDEEAQIRFFARRSEYLKGQEKLIEQRKKLIDNLENAIENNEKIDYSEKIRELDDLEIKIVKERNNFYTSLSDILDYEKIAKLIIFEIKFNEKIKDLMMQSIKNHKKK